MPASLPPVRAHPAKPFRTLDDAARDGQLVHLKCSLCRRAVYFLASDLAKIVDPAHPVHVTPFPCGSCGKKEYVRVSIHSPRPGDVGRLQVRKLIGVAQVPRWRDGRLGE